MPRLLLALLLAFAPAAAWSRSLEDLDACMRANLPQKTSVQTVSFVTTDRIGAHTESRATIYWQRGDDGLSKAMVRLSAPAELRGAGVLVVEQRGRMPDQFMFLPALGRVRRVSTRMMSSAMFGTDFSYEDFTRLERMAADSKRRLLDDAVLDGAPVNVLEITPEPGTSSYVRIVEHIDAERCVPLESDLFEAGDVRRKVATTPRDRVTREHGHWVPRELRMRDLREQTETKLVVEKIEIGVEIPAKIFTQQYLRSRD